MKQKKKQISRLLALTLLAALASAPQFALLRQTSAQERNINVNEKLDFRALGIDNEARQLVSLIDVQAKFFKRGKELRAKSILSPRDPQSFSEEANKRKSDLTTIKSQLELLINKLKQKNHWNEALDAQFLASLESNSDRSLLTQNGGFRKLLEAAVGEVSSSREDIDEEVRQVNTKQTGKLRKQNDRVFAAHASPPFGKAGCNVLAAIWILASLYGRAPNSTAACDIADRMNDKGCSGAPQRCP